MTESEQFFYDLVTKVDQSHLFLQILAYQQFKYHMQSLRIQTIECQAICRIYKEVVNKQIKRQIRGNLNKEDRSDSQMWNQNERKVFIWFIIFYTFFLQEQCKQIKEEDWQFFSQIFFNKSPQLLRFQYLSMIKSPEKIIWTEQEDQILIETLGKEEPGKWNQVAKTIFFSTKGQIFKSPKHCRERWINHLDTSKKKGEWTLHQDLSILKYVAEYGKSWCKMVPLLHDIRTEHMIKNRYNSLLTKQSKTKMEREERLVSKLINQLKKKRQIIKKRNQLNRKECSKIKMEDLHSALEKTSQVKGSIQKETLLSIKIQEAAGQPFFKEKSEQQDVKIQNNASNVYYHRAPQINAIMNDPHFAFRCSQLAFPMVAYPPMFPFQGMYWA